MPPIKISALGYEPIGASWRQPFQATNSLRGEFDAIGDFAVPFCIVGTRTGRGLEQAAGNIGEINIAMIFIFKFDEAAAATPIAEAFPFLFI